MERFLARRATTPSLVGVTVARLLSASEGLVPQAAYNLGNALYREGRYQEALQALDNISWLRTDDHVYRIASLARATEKSSIRWLFWLTV